MLENESLWQVAERVRDLFSEHGIDYAVAGGVAVCLHGYRRNTVDLDLLIRPEQSAVSRSTLEADGFIWNPDGKEFHAPSGIVVQFLMAGDSAGPGQSAKLPDPADARYITTIERLPVLSLARLIEAKLACGLGDLRRTHKDFADVVELIAVNHLDGSFARQLHKSVQAEYRKLVARVR